MPESGLSQSRVKIEIFPPDGSQIRRTKDNHLERMLEDVRGTVTYRATGQGVVHICIEVQEIDGRKYVRPTLVGLRMTESIDIPDVPVVDEQQVQKDALMAKQHLSHMEMLLLNMIKETNMLLKNANLVKDDEIAFHTKSLEMNAASRWWPMLHVIVLLVTGFTQANHVIKFFKTMHII